MQDRYRLERELGSGGMATVYLAQDLRHGRQVAVKVLHPELSAVLGGDRFLSEIKTTAALQHPTATSSRRTSCSTTDARSSPTSASRSRCRAPAASG
jgi:serine/threonine protein kinase